MSDDLTPVADEAIDEAPEVQEPTTESPEDVGALKRALEREREERREAKEALRRLEEDEDARREWLSKHGYEIEDTPDDDPEDFEDDEPEYLTKAEFEELRRKEAAERSDQQFVADMERFRGDRDLSEQGTVWLAHQYREGQIKSPQDLKQAIDGWFSYEDGLRGTAQKPKARTPHVPSGGKAATGVPNYSEMTRDEAEQAMLERARALEAQ